MAGFLARLMAMQALNKGFDPKGEGYDYLSAKAAGLGPGKDGHWPSRDPKGGKLLKGKSHPTWDLLEEGERDAGYEISEGDDGRFYSRKKRGK